jgi:hypothetical protein
MPESDENEKLLRRLARLEGIVLAMLATEIADRPGDIDEFLYLLHRRGPHWREPVGEPFWFEEILERLLRHNRGRVERPVDRAAGDKLQFGPQQRRLVERIDMLQKDSHNYFAFLSLGIDLRNVPLTRFLPMRVYLDTTGRDEIDGMVDALNRALDAFGFTISDEFPEETGSWFKRWFGKTKDAVAQPEVQERLAKVERALEFQGLHLPQAQADKNQADAIAALIGSVERVPTAAIQAGSILLVKTNAANGAPCIQVRTLTQQQMILLEKNQRLLASPNDAFEKLSQLSEHDGEPAVGRVPRGRVKGRSKRKRSG